MMNSSNLTNLNVDAGTEVILGDAANPHSGNRVDLTIANLSGNGTFYVRSDIARDGNTAINNGDKIYITDSSSGAHKVYVRDANLGNIATSTLGTERLRIVEDSSGGTGTFALGGDAGTGIQQTDDNRQHHDERDDDDRVIDEILLGRPRDLLQLGDHVLERTGNAARQGDDPILRAGEETGFFGFLRAFGFRHLFHILVRLVA